MERSDEQEVVVQSFGWKLVIAALRTFGAVICLLAAASGAGGPAGQAGFALLAAAVLLITVRGLWAGALATRDGLVVRNTFRTYRLPWAEIEEVAPPPRPRRRFTVSLTTRSGKRIPVDGCFSPVRGQPEQMAAALRSARPAAAG
jgi:hypothetical protein